MSLRQHIPNAITSLNLVCGVIGIWFTLSREDITAALYLMLAAVVFDFCDGLAARLLDAYSEIGKELDSLADMVSFGVLPCAMMTVTYGHMSAKASYLLWVPVLIAVFSALRLAKFNTDERQHESFIGLPTPACALVCASLCYLIGNAENVSPFISGAWFIPAVSIIMSFLLVCEMPMFSFKFGKNIETDAVTKMKRYAIISISTIIVVLAVVFALPFPAIIMGVLLAYILENALCFVFKV